MEVPLKGTLAFVSLGCAKNLVDSERMLGLLAQDGYGLVSSPDDADVVVVNTCGFIEESREESLGVIREMAERKRQGRLKGLVVAGCLAERNRQRLLDEVPDIDQLVGVFGRDDIADACDQVLFRSPQKTNREDDGRIPLAVCHNADEGLDSRRQQRTLEQRMLFRPAPVRAMTDLARLRITPRHYAYLKISEGCDRLCTFCSIPGIRGKHVSKPIEDIVAEAEELAGDGVRELILVAQDTTYYGLDLYGEVRLADLLRHLEQVRGIEWIRLLYTYPIFFTDELVETLAQSPKMVPYLDLPLQHINDRVLKRMQRRVTRSQIEELIGRLRNAVPGLVLRTTFIVGFPGETDQQFDELCRFVETTRFERVGVFTYSFEPNTPSARLDGHLPEEVKEQRRDCLMQLQQQVAFEWSQAQIGREMEVIIDGPDDEVPGWFQGRSHADAPDIDAIVRVKGKRLDSGDLVRTKITAADGYDLTGRAIAVR